VKSFLDLGVAPWSSYKSKKSAGDTKTFIKEFLKVTEKSGRALDPIAKRLTGHYFCTKRKTDEHEKLERNL
jgi:hypothetical protein